MERVTQHLLEELEEFPEEADLTPSNDFRIDVVRMRGYREVNDPTRSKLEWSVYQKKIDNVLTMQVCIHVYHRAFVVVNAIAYIDWYGKPEYDYILLDQLKVHSHNELNAELARLEEGAKSKFGNIDESTDLPDFPDDSDLELSAENVDAEKVVKRVMDGGADLSDYEKIVVMRNPWQAYLYADQELKRRWHEAEPYIMRDPFSALWYAIEVIGGRWIEAEPYILESPSEAGAYAGNILKAPWPEAEARCAADPNYEAAYREYAQPYDPGQEERGEDGVAESLLPIVASVASSVATLREGLIVPILVSESGIVIGKACAKLPMESIGCITASAVTAELHEDCARQAEIVRHSVVLYTVDKDGSISETYFNPTPRVYVETPHERAHEALQAEQNAC